MFKLNLGSLPPKSTTPSNSEPSSSASTPVDEQQQQAPITSRIDSSSTDTILRLNMSSLSQLRNGKLTADQHYQNNNDNDPIDDDDDDNDDDDEQHEESGGDNEDEIRTTLMPKLQLNLSSMKLSNASIAAAASSATTTAMVDEETLSNSNNHNSDNNQVKTNNKRIVTVDLIVPQFCKCVVESSESTNEYNQVKQHIENKWLKTQQRSNEQNQNCNTTTTTNDVDVDDNDKKSIKPNISLYKIQSVDANNNNSSVDDENLACSLTLPIIMDTTNGDTSDLNPQQLSIFTVSSLNELIAQNQSLTIKYQKAMSALMEYSTQNQSLKQELSQNKKQIEELNRTRLEMRTLVDSLMHQHQLLAQSMLSTSAASHHQHPTASEPMVKTIPVPQPSKKNRKKKRTIKRKEQQKAQQQQQQPQQQQSSQNKNKK